MVSISVLACEVGRPLTKSRAILYQGWPMPGMGWSSSVGGRWEGFLWAHTGQAEIKKITSKRTGCNWFCYGRQTRNLSPTDEPENRQSQAQINDCGGHCLGQVETVGPLWLQTPSSRWEQPWPKMVEEWYHYWKGPPWESSWRKVRGIRDTREVSCIRDGAIWL